MVHSVELAMTLREDLTITEKAPQGDYDYHNLPEAPTRLKAPV